MKDNVVKRRVLMHSHAAAEGVECLAEGSRGGTDDADFVVDKRDARIGNQQH